MNEALQPLLQTYYRQLQPTAHIGPLTCLSSGWESDVYAFDLTEADAIEPLVLRLYPGADAYWKSAREFAGLQTLHAAGYPAPAAKLLEREASPFGQPFIIMERVEGQNLWPLLFHGPEDARPALLTQFCELFRQLHTLDWRPFADESFDCNPAQTGTALIDRWLNGVLPVIERFPKTDFAPVFAWLQENRFSAPCTRPSVIHWDFHPANVLYKPNGDAIVIDWTQIEVSDYRFDLAWTLLLIGCYEGTAHRAPVLAEYERLAGKPVEGLAYFDVAAAAKRLYSIVVSISEGAAVMGMRAGAEETMKAQIPAIAYAYELLRGHTGIRLQTIEDLLA